MCPYYQLRPQDWYLDFIPLFITLCISMRSWVHSYWLKMMQKMSSDFISLQTASLNVPQILQCWEGLRHNHLHFCNPFCTHRPKGASATPWLSICDYSSIIWKTLVVLLGRSKKNATRLLKTSTSLGKKSWHLGNYNGGKIMRARWGLHLKSCAKNQALRGPASILDCRKRVQEGVLLPHSFAWGFTECTLLLYEPADMCHSQGDLMETEGRPYHYLLPPKRTL